MAATRLLGRTLLAAIAVAGATATPTAVADPAPAPHSAPDPLTILRLSATSGYSTTTHSTATLTCHPAGGTHSSALEACRSLSAAGGSFESLRTGGENTMCPLIYKPVTVRATGMWNDEAVNFEQTYPNQCVLEAYTGPVFTF